MARKFTNKLADLLEKYILARVVGGAGGQIRSDILLLLPSGLYNSNYSFIIKIKIELNMLKNKLQKVNI